MRIVRWSLITGGIFNCVMGLIFFSNTLLAEFLAAAVRLEYSIFSSSAFLPFPNNPVHLLLIHGFGAAALILGATLLAASRNPSTYLPFILFDAAGRLLFGGMMIFYVLSFSLLRIILFFGILESLFGILYVWISWRLAAK